MKSHYDTFQIAADSLEDTCPEAASALRSEEASWIGKRVAVYGPNYIWWGTLKALTDRGVILTDVYQVDDVPDLVAGNMQGQKHSETMLCLWGAICNYSPVNWSV